MASQRSSFLVFGAVLAACLLVQGWTWLKYWPLDHQVFVSGVEYYAAGRSPDRKHPVDQYPAATILVPAGALAASGMSPDRALRVAMALLVSLVAALLTTVAFLLRPKTLWWVFVAWLLVFQPLYTLGTPPAALQAVLTALFALLILLACEKHAASLPMLAGVGLCGGAMIATRIDMGAAFLGAGTLFLALRRRAALYMLPLVAAASWLLIDPLARSSPVWRVTHIVDIVLLHAQYLGETNAFVAMTYASPFGIVSLVLAGALLLAGRLQCVPRDFGMFLVATSVLVIVALCAAKHHPAWLFYTPLLVWELLLPLVVSDGIQALPEKSALGARARASGRALAVTYMLYQAWVFYFRVT